MSEVTDGMKAFVVEEDGRLVPAAESTETGEQCTWLDLQAVDGDDLKSTLESLAVPERLVSYSTGTERFARVVSQGDTLFLRIPAFVDPDNHHPAQVRFLVSATRLITLHDSVIPAIDVVLASGRLDLHEARPMAALYAILNRMIDRIIHFFMESRALADEMTRHLDEGLGIPVHDIIALRHRIGHLAIACEDQLYCLKAIETAQAGQSLSERQRTMFQDSVELLNHTHKGLLRLEGVVRDLHQTHLGHLQNNSNRRLRDLTIISAMFMPPTLLAGVYGMNFRAMPELTEPYGYPAVLISMFAVACGMLAYFRKRGWFDE